VLDAPCLFDLTGRGTIVLTGKDRASFLHSLVTNDVKSLRPGTGCYAAFLTPKGKMLADLTVLCSENEILIDCESELTEKLAGLLKKYLIFTEAVIENRTQETGVLHVEGGATGDLLRKVMGTDGLPERPHEHAEVAAVSVPQGGTTGGSLGREDAGVPVRIVSESRGGSEGFDLRLPRVGIPSLLSLFGASGLSLSSPSLLEAARIEAGIPRWGAELDETVLPDEAGLAERGAISYTKGCYIGQEIVARIKTYGHVNRALVRLVVDGEAPPPGSEIFLEGQKTGRVTSSTRAGEAGRAIALGYVKREHAAPGTVLTVALPSGTAPSTVASGSWTHPSSGAGRPRR
jgi:folate-binding protein YgfZ